MKLNNNYYSVAKCPSCKVAVHYVHSTATLQVKLLCYYNHIRSSNSIWPNFRVYKLLNHIKVGLINSVKNYGIATPYTKTFLDTQNFLGGFKVLYFASIYILR